MLRQVNIDGVLYKIGDSRFEGDNLAYIQLLESITVGTPLTDLAPIQKALDSTDGSLLYAPSLNIFFAPTASTTPTTRIWASTTGDKGYQLKATLNESGILSSAVVVEAPAGEGWLVISAEDWAQIRTEMEDDDNWDDEHVYLITDKAKEIAGKLIWVDASANELTGVDKFQVEHMSAYTGSGISMPVDYFYESSVNLDLRTTVLSVEFISSGSETFYDGGNPQSNKYKLGAIMEAYGDSILGLLVSIDDDASQFNFYSSDYQEIAYNTSQLTTSDSYDDSDLAKEIGKELYEIFMRDSLELDHFIIKYGSEAFYTYNKYEERDDGNRQVKFTTTSEDPDYSGDIYVIYNVDDDTCLGMRIDPKPEEFVRISKEYMEVPTGHAPHTCLEASISGTTLNITHKNESHISSVIHVPKSVLFTSPNAFELKFAPIGMMGDPATPYTPDAKIEISKDGLNWTQPTWDETNGISLKADTLNNELGKYSVFIRSDNYINEVDMATYDMKVSGFSEVSGSNIEVSGILDAMWGGKAPAGFDAMSMFGGMANLIGAKDLVFPATVGMIGYAYMFMNCASLTSTPALPATTLAESCYMAMFSGCTSLTTTPVLPAMVMVASCYNSMFYRCTSLTKAPDLPATTLANMCYNQMFSECTSLTTTPELPATVLDTGCYSMMFRKCTSLTKPITFPEITSIPSTATGVRGCFTMMFDECTGIEWATTGTPYIIKTTDGSTSSDHSLNMFRNNTGNIPEGTGAAGGSAKLNTTYYLT